VDPAQFFAASRVVIVAGKGGVGKTTVTATLARAAAKVGLTSLIVEVEGKSGLAACFGQSEALEYDERALWPGGGPAGEGEVRARTVTPDQALLEYLEDHGMARIARRLVSTGALDVVATAAPGIKDILVLGKVKQLDVAGQVDLVLVDAPAAGHAITFLRSASALIDAVKVGPINAQAKDVLELLTDPARCQVVLVTLPEETPVNEVVQTAYSLEDQVGIKLGPVVVNGLYEPRPGIATLPEDAAEAAGVALRPGEAEVLGAAADFRQHRMDLQREQLERLAERLPLPRIALPFLFTTEIGPDELDRLADAVLAAFGDLSADEVLDEAALAAASTSASDDDQAAS
jgi:anion-transporting  ArsA/GET3 family ATPase